MFLIFVAIFPLKKENREEEKDDDRNTSQKLVRFLLGNQTVQCLLCGSVGIGRSYLYYLKLRLRTR